MFVLADNTGTWAIIGQISVIVGIIGSVVGTIAHFRGPKERLEAVVVQQHFSLPFKPRDAIEKYKQIAAKEIKTKHDTFYEHSMPLVSEFDSEYYADLLRRVSDAESIWNVRVDNLGSKKCTGVKINLPGGIIAAQIMRGKTEAFVNKPDTALVIGDMSPRETIYITAWSWNSSGSNNYSSVVITHDSGVGKLRPQFLTNRIGEAVGREPLLALLLLTILEFVVVLLIWTLSINILHSSSPKPTIGIEKASPTPSAIPSNAPLP